MPACATKPTEARLDGGMSRYHGNCSSNCPSVEVANSPEIDFSHSRVACLVFATGRSRGSSGHIVKVVLIDGKLRNAGVNFAALNQLL